MVENPVEKENEEQLLTRTKNENLSHFEQNLRNYFEEHKMKKESREKREKIIELVEKYLRSDGIQHQLVLDGIHVQHVISFGSFPTKCATDGGDIDLCVCATSDFQIKPVQVLQGIYRELINNTDLQSHFSGHNIHGIKFVNTAKVPIIRFSVDEIPFDLSANVKLKPPRTSIAARFINAHCQLDERFPVLAIILKKWMSTESIRADHRRNLPNGYSLTMLLIHFLQYRKHFPNLHKTHKEKFSVIDFRSWQKTKVDEDFMNPLDERAVSHHRQTSKSRNLTIVQLLREFAQHYSDEFRLKNFQFQMVTGKIAKRTRGFSAAIVIHDPYDGRNPARSTRTSLDFSSACKDLVRLIDNPDANMFENFLRIIQEKTYFVRNPQFLFDANQRGVVEPKSTLESPFKLLEF